MYTLCTYIYYIYTLYTCIYMYNYDVNETRQHEIEL